MSLMFWAIVVSLGYVVFDVYKNREKIREGGFVYKIWGDLKSADFRIWATGFFMMIVVMFGMRAVVIGEYEAQSCEVSVVGFGGYANPNMNVVGMNAQEFVSKVEQNRSYNYYRRFIKLSNKGLLPPSLNMTCSYNIEGTWQRIKEDYQERGIYNG